MDSLTAPLFPSDSWAATVDAIARIPRDPPPRRRHRLEPIRWVRRVLTSPKGQVVEALVPVYGPPGPDTYTAPLPARYNIHRREE